MRQETLAHFPPTATDMCGSPTKEAGFTLMELIIVLVVVGLLSAYAMMRNSSSSVFSLLSQAQTLASDIKHVQSMATVWGKSLTITATNGANGSYSVSCTNSTAAPCNGTAGAPVINPATGIAFTISLQKGVVLAGTPATLVINSLGQPASAAQYVLTTDGGGMTVNVAALTGNVTVSP
jgi:MSHA pilin protein MshC